MIAANVYNITQGSLYPTHALYEASLRGNQEIISALLKRDDLDVNLPAVCLLAAYMTSY